MAKEAIVSNKVTPALTFVGKAQLAVRPTTEYFPGKPKRLEDNGSQACEKGDFAHTVELWQKSLIECGLTQKLAGKRGEKEIIEAVTSAVATMEVDMKTAQAEKPNGNMLEPVEQAHKAVDEASERFELARRLWAKGTAIYLKSSCFLEPIIL